MNRDVARLRPAPIVRVGEARTIRTEIVGPASRRELAATLRRMVRRDEIGSAYDLRRLPSGLFVAKVVRLKEARPPIPLWAKVAAGLALGVAVVAGLVWLVSVAISAAAAAAGAVLPVLLGAAGVVALLALGAAVASSGSTIEVLQRVTIKR